MKKFMTMMAMMLAVVTMCGIMTSCGGDDEDNTPAAAKIVGTYVGDMSCTVSTSTSTVEAAEFQVVKVDDSHVNITLPAFGSAPMALPAITVKNLTVTESNGTYTIPQTSFDQTLESGKAIANTAITATIKDGKMHIQFSMKYGSMPFNMICECQEATKK